MKQQAFIAFLVLSLILPLTALNAHASVGIGFSDYDLSVTLTNQTSIKVGKLTNIGNETLIFSFIWKQTNSTVNMTLPVSPCENTTLNAGESCEPTIKIGSYNESFVGNYSGIIQITGTYPIQQSGDVAVPGATLHISLSVPEQEKQQQTLPFTFIAITVIVCILIAAIGVFIVWRRKQRGIATGLVWGKKKL